MSWIFLNGIDSTGKLLVFVKHDLSALCQSLGFTVFCGSYKVLTFCSCEGNFFVKRHWSNVHFDIKVWHSFQFLFLVEPLCSINLDVHFMQGLLISFFFFFLQFILYYFFLSVFPIILVRNLIWSSWIFFEILGVHSGDFDRVLFSSM
jgi:hypothetical protein